MFNGYGERKSFNLSLFCKNMVREFDIVCKKEGGNPDSFEFSYSCDSLLLNFSIDSECFVSYPIEFVRNGRKKSAITCVINEFKKSIRVKIISKCIADSGISVAIEKFGNEALKIYSKNI